MKHKFPAMLQLLFVEKQFVHTGAAVVGRQAAPPATVKNKWSKNFDERPHHRGGDFRR